MPRRPRFRTPLTRKLVQELIAESFKDSQALLAEEAGLDGATVFRLVNGQRPATPEQVGRILAILPKAQALRLMTAFLTDVGAASAPGYSVRVSKP